jgi:hypothetical protein
VEIYTMLRTKSRMLYSGKRILDDQTQDPVAIAWMGEKVENDRTGRRGRNLFRAFPWIGR